MKKQAQKELYHYTDCGLDNVWLASGYKRVSSPYGEGVSINDMDGLHRCIADLLVNKQGPLTGSEFRFLRTELDLSQYAMGQFCGRKERMVRQWETREEPIEEPANTIIRVIYEQRFNPTAKYEEISKKIQEVQHLDRKMHELKLRMTANGWTVERKRA